MDVKRRFATRLKQLREEKGLSQAQLGEKIGVSRGSISFYENESRIPDIEVLEKISLFFEVPSDYLLGLIPNRTRENIDIGSQLFLGDKAIEAIKDCVNSNSCRRRKPVRWFDKFSLYPPAYNIELPYIYNLPCVLNFLIGEGFLKKILENFMQIVDSHALKKEVNLRELRLKDRDKRMDILDNAKLTEWDVQRNIVSSMEELAQKYYVDHYDCIKRIDYQEANKIMFKEQETRLKLDLMYKYRETIEDIENGLSEQSSKFDFRTRLHELAHEIVIGDKKEEDLKEWLLSFLIGGKEGNGQHHEKDNENR